MTKQNRKILLICLAVIVASYVVRSIVTSANQLRAVYAQRQAIRQRQKANQKPSSASPAAGTTSGSPADAPVGNLSGVWVARGAFKSRGMCDIRLELKEEEPGRYTAYSRFACLPMATITDPKSPNVVTNMADALPRMSPDSAILTGTVEKGSIHLHTNKTIGTDFNGCTVSDFTITPFGKGAIAAEWKEETCQGGNVLMTREGR